MSDDKVSMPTTTAGITRFTDDYKSKIHFPPYYVIIFVVLILLLIYLLDKFGPAWLGIPPIK